MAWSKAFSALKYVVRPMVSSLSQASLFGPGFGGKGEAD